MKFQVKQTICLLVLLLMANIGQAQRSVDVLKEFEQDNKGSIMINIPGFVAKMAANSQTDKEFKPLMKKVKKMRVFVSEEGNEQARTELVRSLNRLFEQQDYKSIMTVKSNGDEVNFQFLPTRQKEKGELVIVVDDKEDLVAVVIEGDFTEDDAKELVRNTKSF